MYDDDYNEGMDLKKAIKDSVREYVNEEQQAQAYRQNQERQREVNELIARECEAAGISVEDFNSLINNKDIFRSQVREIASKAAKAKGKKPVKPQDKESASVAGRGRTAQKQFKRFDPDNRRGTDDEVLDMITDMLGDDPMFKYGS